MNMEAIKAEIQEALALVEDAKQLADFWAKYFGKGGEIQKLMAGIKKVPNEEKKAYGQAVNEGGGESNGGNMDRGPMMFTSDVSLPKDDKTTMLGEQITAGQLTEL